LTTDEAEFSRLAEPFRKELLAHCYRMLGSVDEAEDVVQETYLRAWRGFDGFEGRSSVRTWLYRIATNASLTALERRTRRALPSGLGGPSDDPDGPVVPAGPDVAWLEALPDRMVEPAATDPATIVATRQSLRLALVASLQYLSPKQRAVLILRDVLAWPATEVASMLDLNVGAVKSLLQRARGRMSQVAPVEDDVIEPDHPEARALVDRYIAAFENADADELERLLRTDAAIEMAGVATWFCGKKTCISFLMRTIGSPGDWILVPAEVNGQLAVAGYSRSPSGGHEANSIGVLTLTTTGISRVVVFSGPQVFERLGLPLSR
jgi:RNA polymerase sigma-70 factor, ECF subfamily